jgi:hypothetical protein
MGAAELDPTEVEPERRETIARARSQQALRTHETVGRGQAAVPLRDVPDQPVTTLPNPRCRRRCRRSPENAREALSDLSEKGL